MDKEEIPVDKDDIPVDNDETAVDLIDDSKLNPVDKEET